MFDIESIQTMLVCHNVFASITITPQMIAALLDTAGISARMLARILDISEDDMECWQRDGTQESSTASRLLYLFCLHPELISELYHFEKH